MPRRTAQQVILAFTENGTVELYDTEEAAAAAYSGVDIDSEVVTFYRDDGTYLEPMFTVPNRYVRFLGLFWWSQSGAYRLVPQPNSAADPFWLALLEHSHLKQSHGFTSIDQLKEYLTSRGAIVERPAPAHDDQPSERARRR